MITCLKPFSGLTRFSLSAILIFVFLLIAPGGELFAQSEIFGENSVGGGPYFGYATNDGNNAYQVGVSGAFTPNIGFGFAVNRYDIRGESVHSFAPSFTFYPVKLYGKNSRFLLSFHAEYEDALKDNYRSSYLLGFTLMAGGQSTVKKNVFLPYFSYGHVNVMEVNEKEHTVLGYGLIIGSKVRGSDSYFVVSVGASRYAEQTTYGGKLAYFIERIL